MSYLNKIMSPRGVAVIGASNKEHTIGSDIMKRLVEYGFTGKIFPINPKDSEIQGMTAYPSVLEVPEEIDMAVIVINAKYVLSAVDQCHQKGIKGIVVISAGFKETRGAGAELEAKLVNKVREYGMTCVGPNCLGVVNTDPEIQTRCLLCRVPPRSRRYRFRLSVRCFGRRYSEHPAGFKFRFRSVYFHRQSGRRQR